MTKPLGITIEESTDKARLVYVTSVGEKVCCCCCCCCWSGAGACAGTRSKVVVGSFVFQGSKVVVGGFVFQGVDQRHR